VSAIDWIKYEEMKTADKAIQFIATLQHLSKLRIKSKHKNFILRDLFFAKEFSFHLPVIGQRS
jgi:hypothetical protein